MRDGLSIYDKVISSVEGDISYKDVATSLNVLDYEYYFKIVDAAIKEDLTEIMVIFDDIIKKGFESEQFVLGLMKHLRDLMMIKDVRTASILDTAESLSSRYEDQASLTTQSFLLSALSLLNQTDINLPRSQNKRLSVEIALSRMCYVNRIVEKKNEVVTEDPPIPKKISSEKGQSEKVKDQKPSPEPKTVPKASKTESPAKTPKSKTEASKKIASPKSTIRGAIPTIDTNLDALLNGGNQDNTKKKNAPFTVEELKKIFQDYQEKSGSKSVSSALKNIKLEIRDEAIVVLSPNQVFLDFVKQETALLEQLHDDFSDHYKKIIYEVSPETFPDYTPPKKPRHLTTKEKYDLLLEKNPDFGKLVDEFKLKIKNN